HPTDNRRHQQRSQYQQDAMPPVQQDPSHVQQDDDADQANAQRNEKRDRLLPSGDYHNSSLQVLVRQAVSPCHSRATPGARVSTFSPWGGQSWPQPAVSRPPASEARG